MEVKTIPATQSIQTVKDSARILEVLTFLSSVKGICALAVFTRLSGLDRFLFGGVFSPQYFDKVGHLLFFGLLSVSFHYVASRRTSWEPGMIIGSSFLLVAIFAIGDEFSQIWFENRKFEHLDLLANIMGAGVMGPLGCLSGIADLHLSDKRKGEHGMVGRSLRRSRTKPFRAPSIDATRVRSEGCQFLRILLVEENVRLVRRVSRHLEALNESLEECQLALVVETRLAGAVQRLETSKYDLVLIDLSLPDCQGIRVYDEVVERVPDTPVVALTGDSYWESIDYGGSRRRVPSCSKDQLNPETLFWLVYDAMGEEENSSSPSPLGFARCFGRISVGSAAG